MEHNQMHDCAEIVNRARLEMGITTRALSKRSGVPESVLYRIMNKKRKMSAEELLAVSSVLHLHFEDFADQGA